MKHEPDNRQLALIKDHLDAMLSDDEAERIGATADRAPHIRVLRVLSQYEDMLRLTKQICRIDVDAQSAEHAGNLAVQAAIEARKILES